MSEDNIDDLGEEAPNSERLRRMKEIMGRINGNDDANGNNNTTHTVPVVDLKIPPVRSRYFIIGASLGSILLLLSSVLYKYNWFGNANEDILAAHGAIDNSLQQRANLFDNLVNLTLNQAAMEQETLRFVAEIRARQGLLDKDLNQALPLTDLHQTATKSGSMPEIMARLFAVAEQYPDIKTSATYRELMGKLMDLEERIRLRRDEYHDKVRIFNAMVVTFPWQLVAFIGGFRRYPYSLSDPQHPELKIGVDSFRRLIPKPKETTAVKDNHDAIEAKP